MWLYLLGGLAVVIAAVLWSPIVISFSFEESVQVTLSFWFFRYSLYPLKKKPKKEKTKAKKEKRKQRKKKQKAKESPKPTQKVGVVQRVKDIFGVLGTLFHGSLRLLENAKVKKLNITLGITGEDAAKAAINYGLVCSVVYPFLGLVDNHMNLKKPKVNLYCDYLNTEPTIQGSGKVYIRVHHAVSTAFYMLIDLVKKNLKR